MKTETKPQKKDQQWFSSFEELLEHRQKVMQHFESLYPAPDQPSPQQESEKVL